MTCLVDVGDLVEAHLAPVGLGERLARDDLEEEHELEAVPEVLLDVLDLRPRLPQVRVHPCRERLQYGGGYGLKRLNYLSFGLILL